MFKKQLFVIPILLLVYGFHSPNLTAQTPQIEQNSPRLTPVLGDTSANALDWNGTYEGILPCADCEGIKTTLTLNRDLSFFLQTQYLGKNDQVFTQEGTFKWNDTQNKIILQGLENSPNQFLVGENMLLQLDLKGDRIQGDLAEKYQLLKVNNMSLKSEEINLFSKKWQLIEMMGKEIKPSNDEDKRTVFIMFDDEEKRVNGFSGCNNFLGSFELKEGNRISFSPLASTMMACENMENESSFLQTLQTVDNYTINDGILSLNRARMAPLLIFKVMN